MAATSLLALIDDIATLLDDAGLLLSRRPQPIAQALGAVLLGAAPWLMQGLSVAGTAAMFLVGGGILVHGITPLHQAVEGALQGLSSTAQVLLSVLVDAAIGILAGALVLVLVKLGKRLIRRPDAAA